MVACDGSKSTAVTSKSVVLPVIEKEMVLQGNVVAQPPVRAGRVQALAENSKMIAEVVLENSARYQLTIPAGTQLPLILNYLPANGDEKGKMICVVVQTGIQLYDISSLTTAIAKEAQKMGGYTVRNMKLAAADSVHVPDANKTTTGFRGDPTTQYGGWH
jgi:hypothetical protein